MTNFQHQNPPSPSDHPPINTRVLKLMIERMERGHRIYGTHLQPFNNRSNLQDAAEEAADLVQYLVNEIYERELLESFLHELVEEYEKVKPVATATLSIKFIDALENISFWLRQAKGEGL